MLILAAFCLTCPPENRGYRLHDMPRPPTFAAARSRHRVAKQEQWEQAKADIEGLGLFVRSPVGLDREAATQAIAAFVSSKTLGANQFEFMSPILEYLTEHGAMKPELFYATPFTNLNPQGPEGVFDSAQVDELVSLRDEARARAVA